MIWVCLILNTLQIGLSTGGHLPILGKEMTLGGWNDFFVEVPRKLFSGWHMAYVFEDVPS
jgi:hypothetical protein